MNALRISSAITAAMLVLAPAIVHAQQSRGVPTRTLTSPEVEFDEPFSGLVGIRELSDGRVIVADRTEKIIAILDLAKGSITRIGSEGQGPREFSMPTGIIVLPGDTTLVSDMLLRKFLRIGPSGTLLSDLPHPGAGASAGPGMRVTSLSVGSADGAGRIYWLGNPFRPGANGFPEPVDSAPITRWDPRADEVDTVTFMRVTPPRIETEGAPVGSNQTVRMTIGSRTPFVTQTTWAVAPDGRIAIITPEPYQVTWISPTGQRTTGAPIPYERVRVTEAEKEAYRRLMRESPLQGTAVRVENGVTSTSTVSPSFSEPATWPEYKHPFGATLMGGGGVVMVAPTGELWLRKQLAHTEKKPVFDVIGPRGDLLRRVVLPERTRVLGFGQNGGVYVVRTDEDDLQYVQRYRM